MKKTLITLMALAGLAVGGEKTITLNLMPQSYNDEQFFTTEDDKWQSWTWSGETDTDKIENNLSILGLTSTSDTGYYYFNHLASDKGEKMPVTFAESTLSLTGFGEGAENYTTRFICDVKVSSLLEGCSTSSLSSLSFTVTGTGDGNTGYVGWGLFKLDRKNKVTKLFGYTEGGQTSLAKDFNGDRTLTLTEDQLAALKNDDKLFVMYCNKTGGKTTQITDLYCTAIIPEPATATLSLLALAGLAARRRRK